MNLLQTTLVIILSTTSMLVVAEEIEKAYEMPTYVNGNQLAGTHLNYPGDSYRYTFIIDDEYSNDPQYRIKSAIVGVHILDKDRNANQKDEVPEWGRILINDKPQNWIKPDYLVKYNYQKGNKSRLSDVLEIQDDFEISNLKTGVPPYIFDVTEVSERNRRLSIEVTNVRSNGEVEGKEPFGDFTVLRIGYRVTWEKITAP